MVRTEGIVCANLIAVIAVDRALVGIVCRGEEEQEKHAESQEKDLAEIVHDSLSVAGRF